MMSAPRHTNDRAKTREHGGKKQSDDRLQRNVQERIPNRDPHRVPKKRVMPELAVVCRTDPFRGREKIPVGKADHDRPNRWGEVEDAETDDRRCDEEVPRERFLVEASPKRSRRRYAYVVRNVGHSSPGRA